MGSINKRQYWSSATVLQTQEFSMSKRFLNDDFFASMESSIVEIKDAESLPPLCYTDREFFEFEKEAIFK